jgi:hypothetical protein
MARKSIGCITLAPADDLAHTINFPAQILLTAITANSFKVGNQCQALLDM